MAIKTSIKIKKLWWADVASDGGIGTNWQEIQIGARESTAQLNGSDADVSDYKNIGGSILESDTKKGAITINFQLADLTPAVIAEFTGGTVSTTSEAVSMEAPINQNQVVEKSIKILTGNNVVWRFPRVSFDGYPMVNDDDLHYYDIKGKALQPSKTSLSVYGYDVLLTPSAKLITSFVLAAQTGAATITEGTHTVAITVANGTAVTALEPVIGVSIGASITPNSGSAQSFASPVVYTVEAADGTTQTWTVTVTVAGA